MPRRRVVLESKPRALIRREEKSEVPPLGIWADRMKNT
jgi:hypothetical protein